MTNPCPTCGWCFPDVPIKSSELIGLQRRHKTHSQHKFKLGGTLVFRTSWAGYSPGTKVIVVQEWPKTQVRIMKSKRREKENILNISHELDEVLI